MSVITEAKFGDQIVIVGMFTAKENGRRFDCGASDFFGAGQVVKYLGVVTYNYERQGDKPWLVQFMTSEGKTYAANHLFFMSEAEWQKEHALKFDDDFLCLDDLN